MYPDYNSIEKTKKSKEQSYHEKSDLFINIILINEKENK